jgi:hypothetical protein
MYVTQWSDPDVGNNGDDLAGSDTTLSLGYAYNNNAVDATYATAGLPPPASGYDFFAGPIVDAPGQTGIFDLKIVQDKRNLGMTSYASFSAGAQASDPGTLGTFDVTLQWFNLMRGFLPRPADIVNPSPFIDPTTGLASKFTLSGDPITDSGWVDSGSGDRRILLSSGPFTMALGDTQDVVIAALAAIGTDRLSSVAVLKFTDASAQEAFDLLFELPSPPAKPVAEASELENAIFLNWAVDGDAVALTEGLDAKGFVFEGYNVYQLPSAGATKDDPQTVRLATFDVVNNFTTITQKSFDVPTGQILSLPVQFGNNTGISRTLTVTSDAIRGLNLINGQTYFFGISSYSNNPDPAATLKSLESTLTVLTVTPQTTKLGTRLTVASGDTLAVNHASGVSDGAVVPQVLDPAGTVDANYEVTFKDIIDDSDPEHPVTVTVWDLTNTTSGEVLLADQTNQSGDANYLVTEGLQVVVSGPALNLLDWSWEEGTGEFGFTRWTTGGGGQGGEQFFEGAFLAPNFNGSGLAPGDYRSIFVQFFGMESFTDLNSNSQYDIGEPYQLRAGAGQVATLVSGFGPGLRTGTAIVPFQAFDMDADPMRQLDIVVRDRDGNGQWDLTAQYEEGDPNFVSNGSPIGMGGDFRFNYVNIYDTDYDATGANWDPAQGGQDPTIGAPDPIQIVLWMGDRGTGVLGGDFTMTFTAPKVNTTADMFSFTSTGPSFSQSTAKQDALELINVFPNPYLGVNRFEQNRFQRKVTFSHLPENATIRIFNLAGILVRKLEKSDASQFAEWNMQNENGNPVASGIYVVNIEMPDLRVSKNLKLAVVVEETFLRRF